MAARFAAWEEPMSSPRTIGRRRAGGSAASAAAAERRSAARTAERRRGGAGMAGMMAQPAGLERETFGSRPNGWTREQEPRQPFAGAERLSVRRSQWMETAGTAAALTLALAAALPVEAATTLALQDGHTVLDLARTDVPPRVDGV